jgi:cell division protease FtsH
VVASFLPSADPIHKITIVPRGMALGLTQQLPMDDKYNYSKEYLEAEIAVMLGGRTAEELLLDSVTTGAGNDFEKATEMARNMVVAWGMSEKMGPLSYRSESQPFAAFWESGTRGQYSEETAREIDVEVKRIVLAARERAHQIISEHKEQMGRVIQALLDREVLDKEDFEALLKGEELRDRSGGPPSDTPSPDAGIPAQAGDVERLTVPPSPEPA